MRRLGRAASTSLERRAYSAAPPPFFTAAAAASGRSRAGPPLPSIRSSNAAHSACRVSGAKVSRKLARIAVPAPTLSAYDALVEGAR